MAYETPNNVAMRTSELKCERSERYSSDREQLKEGRQSIKLAGSAQTLFLCGDSF
jgi:hypothetical protein